MLAGAWRSGLHRLARRALVDGSRSVSGVALSRRLMRVSRVEMSFDDAEESKSVA